MPATYNNKNRIDGETTYITKHDVPSVRLDDKLKAKIVKAFQLSGEYVRRGDISLTVKNPVAQYANNSTVTGRVVVKVPGRKALVTVDLFGYWPSWANVKGDDGEVVRHYSKNHGAAVVSLMQSGRFSDVTSQVLEHIAYTALSVIKARQNTPREGLIKAEVLGFLEGTGIKVVKASYRGNDYNREYLTSKISTMRTIFEAMRSIGQFEDIERKRGPFIVGIEGQ